MFFDIIELTKDLSIKNYQDYLKSVYQFHKGDQGLFIKLVEEVGEVAQVLNIQNGRKSSVINPNGESIK